MRRGWLTDSPCLGNQVYGETHGTKVKRPIRLAIVDDYAVVIAGVASFLADERIDVVETGASTACHQRR